MHFKVIWFFSFGNHAVIYSAESDRRAEPLGQFLAKRGQAPTMPSLGSYELQVSERRYCQQLHGTSTQLFDVSSLCR